MLSFAECIIGNSQHRIGAIQNCSHAFEVGA